MTYNTCAYVAAGVIRNCLNNNLRSGPMKTFVHKPRAMLQAWIQFAPEADRYSVEQLCQVLMLCCTPLLLFIAVLNPHPPNPPLPFPTRVCPPQPPCHARLGNHAAIDRKRIWTVLSNFRAVARKSSVIAQLCCQVASAVRDIFTNPRSMLWYQLRVAA